MTTIRVVILLFVLISCQHSETPYPGSSSELHLLLRADSRVYPIVSAHRGGPTAGYPENALETFRFTSAAGFMLLECDVAMTRDSVLILFHDDTLGRTSTGSGLISHWTWDSLQSINLIDPDGKTTGFRIPRFDSVLVWSEGRTILAVDIKRSVPIPLVVQMIGKYNASDRVTVITYRPEDGVMIHRLNPDLHLSVTIRNQDEWDLFRQTNLPFGQVMAFTGLAEPPSEVVDTLHQYGIATILATFRSGDLFKPAQQDTFYKRILKKGYRIIATDQPVAVTRQIQLSKSE